MGYGNFRNGALAGTKPLPDKIPGAVDGGEDRTFTEVFDLSKTTVDKVAGTSNVVARIPAGHMLKAIDVISSVSLTTSQLSFGKTGALAELGAAKAYGTTALARIGWQVASLGFIAPLAADYDLLMTATVADLPAAGIVIVQVTTSARG